MKSRLLQWARPAGFLVAIFLVWWTFTRGAGGAALFPSPGTVGHSLVNLFQHRDLLNAVAASLRRALEGFGISLVLAVPLGIVLGRVRAADQTVGPVISALQSLPSICWMPISLLWSGLNDHAILFVVVMGSAVSIVVAVRDGVRNLPPGYVQAARTLGTRPLALYTDVLFPASGPTVVLSAKLGWAYAWRALMSGELLFATLGLGNALTLGRELGDIGQVIAVMLVIMLLGIAVDAFIFAPLEAIVRERWGFDRLA